MKKINISPRAISLIGIFSALSVVLAVLIHLPLIPAVSFLEYDPADVPIFLIAALLGPGAGLFMTAIVSVIQGLTVSASGGVIGILMHFIATGSFVAAECIALKILKKKMKSDALSLGVSLLCGAAVMTAAMLLWNLLFTPFYMHIPRPDFLPFLPYILLFNVLKAVINGFAAWILYRFLRKLIQRYIPHS